MKFPYTAWRLTPSFKPQTVELTESYNSFVGEFHLDAGGKYYRLTELFATKGAAIEYGREQLAKHEERLAKQAEAIARKRRVLDKSEAEAWKST